jgi:hypothetical protein
MGLARFFAKIAIPIGIGIAFYFYNKWGFGSVLAGIGAYGIITFVSYLFAGGKDLDNTDSSFPYLEAKSYSSPSYNETTCTSIPGKEATYYEMGLELAKYVGNASKEMLDVAKQYEINKHTFIQELFYLDVFVKDFATYQYFGNTEEKKDVLDGFYSGLSKKRTNINDLQDRLMSYTKALQEEVPENFSMFYGVGKQFASFCGKESNSMVILFATNDASTNAGKIVEMYKKMLG